VNGNAVVDFSCTTVFITARGDPLNKTDKKHPRTPIRGHFPAVARHKARDDVTRAAIYNLFGLVTACLWNAKMQYRLARTPQELGINTVPSIFIIPYKLHTKLFVNRLIKGKGDNSPQDLVFVISAAVITELNCKLRKNMGPANWRPVTKIPQNEVYCP
jgi:hypothetical protein